MASGLEGPGVSPDVEVPIAHAYTDQDTQLLRGRRSWWNSFAIALRCRRWAQWGDERRAVRPWNWVGGVG